MSKRTYTKIKNYSTSIKAEKTIGEIEKMLSQYGAHKILKEYDDEGNPILLAFMIKSSHGELLIKLPANVERIMQIFKIQVSKKKLPKSYWGNKEQASKVAWRIIKDWLDAQLTLLSIKMVKIEEIFLPYMYNPLSKQTLYEVLKEKNFEFPQIENVNT